MGIGEQSEFGKPGRVEPVGLSGPEQVNVTSITPDQPPAGCYASLWSGSCITFTADGVEYTGRTEDIAVRGINVPSQVTVTDTGVTLQTESQQR
jgi:hypothetical protein